MSAGSRPTWSAAIRTASRPGFSRTRFSRPWSGRHRRSARRSGACSSRILSGAAVDLGGHRAELLAGEHGFYGQLELRADAEGQVEARVVVPPLERAHGLRVDLDPLCQGGAAEPVFGTQDRDSIEDGLSFAPSCWAHAS